jgi:beta-1,4-mannosyltransferase
MEQDEDLEPELDRCHHRAYVLVLGDIGRSPRTCNHAVALANVGFQVTLVGYEGSKVKDCVVNSPNIRLSPLSPYPQWMSNWLPRIVSLGFKALWQFITLFFSLPMVSGPQFILMQNPPSIPTLIVAYFYTLFHPRTKLVLDWHNYGFSILQMSFHGQHPLVRLARCIEAFFGPRVHAAFCVSKAMKRDLYSKWNIEATVLYDRPMDSFRPCSLEEKHQLMTKLAQEYSDMLGNQSAITYVDDNDQVVRLRPNRPGVLVSSTSWTPDEDFGILFEALDMYESRRKESPHHRSLPDLICVITGKGPLKDYYKKLIADQNWTHVKVVMPWLEPHDYPMMLGSADLGVCLHTSSSGVDLPMKVVHY